MSADRSELLMKQFIVIIVALLIVGIGIFFPYLVQSKIFIFIDSGTDFIENVWPTYIHSADLIKQGEMLIYSQNIGLGTNIFMGSLIRTSVIDPFSWIIFVSSWITDGLFVGLIPWLLLFKIVLSGVLFFTYLRNRQISFTSAMIGALAYSFSGQMLVRSGWYHYTTEMVYLPLLLMSLDEYVFRHKKGYLLLSYAWIGIYNAYYLIVYSIFGFLYLLYQYLILQNDTRAEIAAKLFSYIKLIVITALLISFSFLPTAINILKSARSQPELAVTQNMFVFSEHSVLTSLSRFFSNDLIRTDDAYYGVNNILEDPILYAGLLVLVSFFIFPLRSKTKRTNLFGLALTVSFLLFPFVASVIGGFYGVKFKTSSFFITVFFILVAVENIDYLIRKKITSAQNKKLILYALIPLFIYICFQLYVVLYASHSPIQFGYRQSVLIGIMLIIYPILIFLIQKSRRALLKIIAIIFMIELIIFGRDSLVRRNTLSFERYEEMTHDVSSVNGYLNDIDTIDDELFFRISKDFGVFGQNGTNDSAAFSYYGTSVYQSFNSMYFARVMERLDLGSKDFMYRMFSGFNSTNLNQLVGVKYYLYKNEQPADQSWELVSSNGNLNLWKDSNYLPFGSIFHNYILETDSSQIPQDQLEKLLFDYLIINEEIDSNSIKKLSIDQSTNLIEKNNSLVHENMQLTEYTNTKITGQISLSKPALIFFPIIFDEGWHLFDEEQKKEIPLKVADYGFMYSQLDQGNHNLILSYRQPYLNVGMIISGITAFILISINRSYISKLYKNLFTHNGDE